MRTILQLIAVLALSSVGSAQTLKLPPRPSSAPEGKELVKAMTPMTLTNREDYIFQQVTNGNVPDFLRKLVALTNTVGNHTVQFYVAPDYFALGSDADYLLTPMTPMLAQRVATFAQCTLATRKISDDIWRAAKVKMT